MQTKKWSVNSHCNFLPQNVLDLLLSLKPPAEGSRRKGRRDVWYTSAYRQTQEGWEDAVLGGLPLQSAVYKMDNSSMLLLSGVSGIAGLSFAGSWLFAGEPKGKAFLWNTGCDLMLWLVLEQSVDQSTVMFLHPTWCLSLGYGDICYCKCFCCLPVGCCCQSIFHCLLSLCHCSLFFRVCL